MIHKKKVIVHEHEKEVTEMVTCDKCGRRIREGPFEVVEGGILGRFGTQYPEGTGGGVEYTVDFCESCFVDLLVPLLESNGVNVTRKEWDW